MTQQHDNTTHQEFINDVNEVLDDINIQMKEKLRRLVASGAVDMEIKNYKANMARSQSLVISALLKHTMELHWPNGRCIADLQANDGEVEIIKRQIR